MCNWHHNAIRIEQTLGMRLRGIVRVPFAATFIPMHPTT